MAGAKKFEELICWQLADELKVRAFRVMSRPAARRDPDFCRELRKSARSAPALIAEGFGRWTNPEFRHYLRLAVGELGETRNAFRDAAQSNYVSTEEYRDLYHLCYRASRACSALIADLERKINRDKKRRREHLP